MATGQALDRRSLLRHAARFGLGYGALQLLGCGGSDATTAPESGDDGTPNNNTGSCSRIPEETAGPYPGDGSNGANVLNQTGVVRQDIRSSFAGLSGSADGVPLSVNLTLVNASTCAPLSGYAVYLWHCDRAGLYSLYSSGVTNQNWLRGVQAADSSGRLSFTSIFPGCYAGRWPHIHFEVFRSVALAGAFTNRIATSQLALPKASCDTVYAQSGYASSRTNLAGITLATDNVFSDGSNLQLATVTGDTNGMVASLTVAVTG
ncbi:MAG: dioxygenase [Gemmatimonadaceae bacterium]|nr:dioxygenase [Gemmatimonadaceae bacterium]